MYMNSLLNCNQCSKEVMVIDIEAQMYVKYTEYYMVKDVDKGCT